jgi:hypothetical protein
MSRECFPSRCDIGERKTLNKGFIAGGQKFKTLISCGAGTNKQTQGNKNPLNR